MGSKIVALAGGMILGMAVLVACEPCYEKLTECKDMIQQKMQKAKTDAETSLATVKQQMNQETDVALGTVEERIDDLIKFVDSIDISKLKGKSRMVLQTMKQKVENLKQN